MSLCWIHAVICSRGGDLRIPESVSQLYQASLLQKEIERCDAYTFDKIKFSSDILRSRLSGVMDEIAGGGRNKLPGDCIATRGMLDSYLLSSANDMVCLLLFDNVSSLNSHAVALYRSESRKWYFLPSK